jgi:hypothetical protein
LKITILVPIHVRKDLKRKMCTYEDNMNLVVYMDNEEIKSSLSRKRKVDL